jgi:hypothetical protein
MTHHAAFLNLCNCELSAVYQATSSPIPWLPTLVCCMKANSWWTVEWCSIRWMQERPNCAIQLWDVCHFCIMTAKRPVLGTQCDLHTALYSIYKVRPGNSKILAQIIDISYHTCKFRIIVECFLFLNFKCNLMCFSAQACMEISKYSRLIVILFEF